MEEFPGALGTSASLILRLGQAFFSSASLLFMCWNNKFFRYSAFCFLKAVMSIVIPWSLCLALVDACSILLKRPIRRRGVVSFIVTGDWVLSFTSLGAACSAASVADYMMNHRTYLCDTTLCGRSQLSATIAFLSCFLSLASSIFNLWLLHSL
ncbi:CASP-like protein 5C1 isoform X3 [Actinidia eriantha]|uniref:CASP-like protein 5C1 isoform X3 n=1 Tax=Actinidia eriantha TaxID=165200 RepID=UPI002585A444|nr:CASP-like protein 5C1 isoform X3 [Actinidia eriantha]